MMVKIEADSDMTPKEEVQDEISCHLLAGLRADADTYNS